jgi:CYTH domain-containing protein
VSVQLFVCRDGAVSTPDRRDARASSGNAALPFVLRCTAAPDEQAAFYAAVVSISLKYAVVERERRFILNSVPTNVSASFEITDRYVDGSRLRLREVRSPDGSVTRKLTHKVRLTESAAEVACTNFYLDDSEWDLLACLPGRVLRKTRHQVSHDGITVLVDVHEDGAIVAEIDDGDGAPTSVPDWLDIVADVTSDESWTGASLARHR